MPQGIPIIIPTEIDAPNSVTGGAGSFNCTITVSALGNTASYVLVSTDQPNVLRSPSGSWPYQLNFPAAPGSTSQTLAITPQSVTSNVQAKVYACENDYDISNPNNWQAQTAISVVVPPAPQ